MMLSPSLRKFALTGHVTCSVGWIGSIAAFLALAVAGLTSSDAQLVRAAYLAMPLIGWTIVVPLSFAALATGLVQATGSNWGVFRHYWVLAKLVIVVLASVLLLVHMQLAGHIAGVAYTTAIGGADLHALRLQLAIDSGAALLALLAAVALGIYKPKGLTLVGRRWQIEQGLSSDAVSSVPRWVYLLAIVALVVLVAAGHFAGAHGGSRP
jgi:hypothetical protein